jgi:hypothetical protein
LKIINGFGNPEDKYQITKKLLDIGHGIKPINLSHLDSIITV